MVIRFGGGGGAFQRSSLKFAGSVHGCVARLEYGGSNCSVPGSNKKGGLILQVVTFKFKVKPLLFQYDPRKSFDNRDCSAVPCE